MKKFFSTIILSGLCATSFAQGNVLLDSLFSSMKNSGAFVTKEMENDVRGLTVRCHASFVRMQPSVLENADSLMLAFLTKNNEKTDAMMAQISATMNEVMKTAEESYHFESHKNGIDTIRYSILIAPGGEESLKTMHDGKVNYYMQKEAVTYEYLTQKGSNNSYGNISYTYAEEPKKREIQRFDDAAYEKLVRDILPMESLKTRKIRWTHEDGEEDNDPMKYILRSQVTTASGTTTRGETVGTIFTFSNEKIANIIRREIERKTLEYLDEHPEQQYRYSFDKGFSFNNFETLLDAACGDDSPNEEDAGIYSTHLRLSFYENESGYHILLLRTTGALWVPREM